MKLLTAALVLLTAVVSTPAALADKPGPVPPCLKYWGETRARAYGYDHFVIIDNACAQPAVCVVSTDVNPKPETVRVAAKQRVEVATFLNSPAYAFTAKVACTMQ